MGQLNLNVQGGEVPEQKSPNGKFTNTQQHNKNVPPRRPLKQQPRQQVQRQAGVQRPAPQQQVSAQPQQQVPPNMSQPVQRQQQQVNPQMAQYAKPVGSQANVGGNVSPSKKPPKKKGGLFGGRKKKDNGPVVMDEQYVAREYMAYRARRVLVMWSLIIGLSLIVILAIWNTLFKPTMQPADAINAVALWSNQYQSQQWDSGVEGYLQANCKELFEKQFKSSGPIKKFELSNLAVERNQPSGNSLFITFFSVDVTAVGGETTRVYCTLPIKTTDTGFEAAGDLIISEKKPFSGKGTEVSEDERLKFNERERDDNQSKEFKSTVTNFFTLGYNNKADVSDIYKGDKELKFEGHFEDVTECNIYKEKNQIGANAFVKYNIVLPNGMHMANRAYMTVEKNNVGTYNIMWIL